MKAGMVVSIIMIAVGSLLVGWSIATQWPKKESGPPWHAVVPDTTTTEKRCTRVRTMISEGGTVTVSFPRDYSYINMEPDENDVMNVTIFSIGKGTTAVRIEDESKVKTDSCASTVIRRVAK